MSAYGGHGSAVPAPAAVVGVLAAALLSFRVGDYLARWSAGHAPERAAQGGLDRLRQVCPKPLPKLRVAIAAVKRNTMQESSNTSIAAATSAALQLLDPRHGPKRHSARSGCSRRLC